MYASVPTKLTAPFMCVPACARSYAVWQFAHCAPAPVSVVRCAACERDVSAAVVSAWQALQASVPLHAGVVADPCAPSVAPWQYVLLQAFVVSL